MMSDEEESGPHILVVDDNPGVARALARLLERLKCRVTCYYSPTEAWAAFQDSPGGFDIFFTDQIMPGMNGTALLEKVRALRPEMKLVLGSASELQAPPNDVTLLRKPYHLADLKKVLTTLANR